MITDKLSNWLRYSGKGLENVMDEVDNGLLHPFGQGDLFDLAGIGVWVFGPHGETLSVNDVLAGRLGYSREEILLLPSTVFTGGRMLELISSNMRRRRQGIAESYDARLLHRDGSDVWFRISSVPKFSQSGEFLGATCFLTDISSQKKSERKLRESEDRHRSIMETISDGYYEADLRGNLVMANGALARIYRSVLGTEIIGQNYRELIDAEYIEAIREAFKSVFYTKQPCTGVRCRLTGLGGAHKWLDISVSPILSDSNRVKGFLGIVHDVTENVESRETLRQSEERYRTILETIQDGYYECDLSGKLLFCNEAFAHIHGASRKELFSINYLDYVTPETAKSIYQAFNQVYRTGEPLPFFEFDMINEDGTTRYLEESVSLIRDAEGKAIGFRGIVRNTTERHRAEEQRRELEERFRTIANNAPVMIWMSRPDKMCDFFNQRWLEFTGRTLEEEWGNGWMDDIHPDDLEQVTGICSSGFHARKPFKMEYRMLRHDGIYRWVQDEGIPRYTVDGDFAGFIGCCLDITELKEAEEALRQSEARYRTILENIHEGYYETDLAGRLTFVNDGLVKMFASSKKKLLGLNMMQFADAENSRRLRDAAQWVRGTKQAKPSVTYEITMSSGAKRNADISLAPIIDDHGHVTGYRGIIRDITERKAAEEALRENEALLRTVINSNPDWIFIKDLNHRYKLVNHSYANSLNIESEDFVGKNDLELGFPEEQVKGSAEKGIRGFWADDLEVFTTGATKFIEEPVNIEGETRLFNTVKVPLRADNGEVWGVLGVARDVTELKLAESALRASEERFAKAFSASPEPMCLVTLDQGQFLHINDAWEQCFGLKREDLIGRTTTDLNLTPYPMSREKFVDWIKRDGGIRDWEFSTPAKDGQIHTFLISIELIELEGQQVMLSVSKDITERKNIEKHLRASEERFAKAFNASPQPMAILELPSRKYANVNDALLQNSGWTREEMIGRTPTELKVWADPEDASQIENLINEQGFIRDVETSFLTRQREVRDFLYSAEQIVFNGQPHLLVVANDITERKRAEKALRDSEERYRILFEHGFAGISRSSSDGRLIDFNDALAQMFGFQTREELLRFSALQFYFDDTERRRMIEALRKHGSVRNVEKLMKRRDGKEIWTLSNVTVHEHCEDGTLIWDSVVLDITERKLIEQELKESHEQLRAFSARLEKVREEERLHLSREIHDNLGQALTGLKLDFSWLDKHLARSSDEGLRFKTESKLKEIAVLLEETIQTVRDIATKMRPGILDTLGLRAAIDWLSREFERRTGIKCKLDLCPEPKGLSSLQAIALYRIFQEILTNIIRHARATEVNIGLAVENEQIMLTVKDNGIGITEEQSRNTMSLGLLGMRERALNFDGNVTINGQPGAGTAVFVMMPIEK